jgi:hypothetical protein
VHELNRAQPLLEGVAMDRWAGLIEVALVFGAVLAFGAWQLVQLRRLRRAREAREAAGRDDQRS